MATEQQKVTGRTQWDLLVEVLQKRRAAQWAAIVGWVVIIGAIAAVRIGWVDIKLNDRSSPLVTRLPSCDDYHISIVSPRDRESVSPPFDVVGSSRAVPEGFELWLFTTPPGPRKQYWPVAPSEVRGEQWAVKVSYDNWKPGDSKYYSVFLVGKDGQALLRYYKATMNALSKPGAQWMPLTETTADMVRCTAAYREIKLK